MQTLKQIILLKKYQCVYIDGSFSPHGGSVACLSYSDGNYRIIKLSPQRDSLDTEYMALIELLKELNQNLTKSQKKTRIKIITDCLNMKKEIYGEKISTKPNLLEKSLDLLEPLNVYVIWRSRNVNKAGIILEQRINSLRGMRMPRGKHKSYYKH